MSAFGGKADIAAKLLSKDEARRIAANKGDIAAKLLTKDEARRIAANVVEATEATEKALNSLDTPQVQSRWAGREPAENLLKGDRNANEEI